MMNTDYNRIKVLKLSEKIELLAKLEARSIEDSHGAINEASTDAINSIIYSLKSFIKDESVTTLLNQYL